MVVRTTTDLSHDYHGSKLSSTCLRHGSGMDASKSWDGGGRFFPIPTHKDSRSGRAVVLWLGGDFPRKVQ